MLSRATSPVVMIIASTFIEAVRLHIAKQFLHVLRRTYGSQCLFNSIFYTHSDHPFFDFTNILIFSDIKRKMY